MQRHLHLPPSRNGFCWGMHYGEAMNFVVSNHQSSARVGLTLGWSMYVPLYAPEELVLSYPVMQDEMLLDTIHSRWQMTWYHGMVHQRSEIDKRAGRRTQSVVYEAG